MKRVLAVLAAVVVVASAATGVLIWRLSQHPPPKHPEISAYADGQLVRIGPYSYCDVVNLNDCETPQTVGELAVDGAPSGAVVRAARDRRRTVAARSHIRGF